ncbi:hypothetical protein N5C66_01655 [Rhizobium pusense]|uniref:hypothetical protein n=1 Tax=Agrobacterium pusense TaxID=648995 RepID=UPI0013003BA2|nr:hypothetical protein [Agrobacterium pusense]MDH1093663.1 hypothetical protein [Agrobacterium pusense]MDH1110441.1 hypothetical protein [Agrobacterium pusense]MDH2194991.1 hypothetical protein [Agrobacterium pusense]
MNHRHADFQSPREKPKTRAYRKKTVKPDIESQALSEDLSNFQELPENDRVSLFPSKPSVDTLDMFTEAGVSAAARGVRGNTNRPSVSEGASPQETGDQMGGSLPTQFGADTFKIDLLRLALDIHGQKVAQALWHEMGLPMPTPPPPRILATSEAAEMVSVFLRECTIPDPRWQMSATELHRRYERWMVGRDGTQLGLHAFGKVAIRCGAKRRRSNGSMYIGIRLCDEGGPNG